MNRTILFISLLFFTIATIAMSDNNDRICKGGCQDPAHRDSTEVVGDTLDLVGQTSVDPNEIIGPQGYDSLLWVSINDVLNYTIYFENDPEFATANAQRVDVRFDFDKKELMKDFILGSYGFANMSWDIEKPSNTYQTRLNLVDTMSIYVDLIAGLDVTKKQAFWKFSSIDPESGFAPWQSDRGMLPVNDSTHVGEGFVRFSIKPYSTMHTGDTISIQANIVFDENDTIPTNRWKNVIDAGNPTSKVLGTPNAQNAGHYNLTFEAADDENGSGVKLVRLYLANQFGVFEEFAVCPVDTTIDFVPEAGRKYEFYSLAEDNVGNREALKEQAELILNNNVAPTDIALSDTIFHDDIAANGFIAEISSVDTEEDGRFTYAMAEGDGAIHNDLFKIEGSQLQAKGLFKCAEDSVYKIRLSTTDKDGLSFSKAFVLNMQKVLVKPEVDTLNIDICEGETCVLYGVEYKSTGQYKFSKENEFMCDSLFVLNLKVLPRLQEPQVTIEGATTLVSSADNNNQWFREDGTPVKGATEKKFTPEEDGVYYVAVLNGQCYSNPSQMYRVVLTDQLDLTMNLQEGWNWVSSSLTGENMQNAKQFIAPIEDYVSRLVGVSSELTNDPQYGLVGNLTTLEPQQGYKLKMTQTTSHTWSGLTAKPETTTIKLHKGWNWIGYIPVINQSLSTALSTLEASENAIIKCEDDFSTFANGVWNGSLDELKPGKGYMYYADQETTFSYPTTRVFVVTDQQNSQRRMSEMARAAAPWDYNEYRYPDNTTIIAKLNVNGVQAVEGTFSVGAFCGKECRGIGKYVNGLLYITVHGMLSDDQQITFKAVENITGNEFSIAETVSFEGQHLGSLANPFVLNANGEATGIESINSGYTVYPRPLRNRLYINGPVENIKAVNVLSTNGQMVISVNGYNHEGIDVSMLTPAIYVVAITVENGEIIYEKVLKANN